MLSELIVIELASVLAGPDVGMFFAELGARVIKIENKLTGGDVTRKWKLANEPKENKVSAYFSAVNWNKEYRFLNLKDNIDKDQVYELIKTADLVITNFKPGDDKKLGMDYKHLCTLKPDLIYGEINGYGSNNKRAAYDVVLQAETGFMSMNGAPDSGPIKMPIALIDVLAAHQLKEGLLLALLKKQKNGKGAKVEVSLYDSALASLKNQATNWLMNHHIPQPIGSLHPNIAPYGETFVTKDNKLVVLAIGSDSQFNKLLDVIEANELIGRTEFLSNQDRVTNRKQLANDLSPYFKLKTREQLIHKFIANDIPAGALNNLDEVFEKPEAKDLILTEEIDGVNTKRVKTAIFKIS